MMKDKKVSDEQTHSERIRKIFDDEPSFIIRKGTAIIFALFLLLIALFIIFFPWN